MIQDKIFFDEKDPTGLSYNTPFTYYGSYQGRLWSKAPGGEIKYYTQNSDLSVYATTGSNQFNGNQAITGSLTVTGGIIGTTATSSYVEYSNVANKPTLVSGSSQVSFSGITNKPTLVSGSSQISFNGITNKPTLVSSSVQVLNYGIFATTGSNGFNGSQSITGSLTVTGQVIAQTINVQQVTSSIVYSSGSNIFGNNSGNTHQFTGSLNVNGQGTFYQPLTNSTAYLTVQNNRSRNAAVYTQTTNGGFYAGTSIGTDTFNYQIYDGVAGSARLTISSTGAATFSSSVTAVNAVLGNTSNNTNAIQFLDANSTKTHLGSAFGATFIQNNNFYNGSAYVFDDNTIGSANITLSAGTINFQTGAANVNPSTKLTMLTNGNVGMGTTSPTNLITLQKLGSVSTTPGIDFRGTLSLGGVYNDLDYNSGRIYGTFDSSVYASARVTIATPTGVGTFQDVLTVKDKNVGIGTDSPNDLMEIKSSTANQANYRLYNTFNDGANNYGISWFRNYDSATNSQGAFINYARTGGSSGDLAFGTGTVQAGITERMRITSGGKIGIQNTDPQGKLEVGIVANNSTYGGHFFSTFQIPLNTWTTVFTAPNNNWAAFTEFTWTSTGDYNRSGAAYMRWAYEDSAANIGVVYTLFNNSQNSTATFRNSGGAIQINITGGAADYYVQVRIQGSKAA